MNEGEQIPIVKKILIEMGIEIISTPAFEKNHYPNPDIIIKWNNHNIAVECGHVADPKKFLDLLGKFDEVWHVPYPDVSIVEIPRWKIIIYKYNEISRFDYLMEEIKKLQNDLKEKDKKIEEACLGLTSPMGETK